MKVQATCALIGIIASGYEFFWGHPNHDIWALISVGWASVVLLMMFVIRIEIMILIEKERRGL